jgi:hypothetical protein
MSYELKQIRGIPYYLREKTLYTFELNNGLPAITSIAIGTYDEKNNAILYYPDWKERAQPRLDFYRSNLNSLERDKLRENIVKPVKKSRKVARNPRKASKAASAESE